MKTYIFFLFNTILQTGPLRVLFKDLMSLSGENLSDQEKSLTLPLPVGVSRDIISGKCFMNFPAQSGSCAVGQAHYHNDLKICSN